jgi:predicted  nucleic acid-binding Zn-ribbon protein
MSVEELEALLLVQEHDTARDRLRHRRAALPERAELDANATQLRARESEASEVRGRRDAVLADEKRLDDEARSIGSRADEVNTRLYSGSTNSPKELQAMQADIDMLKRHRSDLEDQELEVMEARETLDAELATADAESARLTAEMDRLRAIIAAAEVEIDAELVVEDEAWAKAAAAVPEALLVDYQRRRAQNKGAGAARLVGTSCTACHLSIPSNEAEQIRKSTGDAPSYCDNCGAILVP